MTRASSSDAVSIDARICSQGLRATLAVALAASVAQVVDLTVLDSDVRLLDMNTHASMFGVVSLLASGMACVAAALLATAAATHGRVTMALPVLLVILIGLRLLHPSGVVLLALPLVAATFLVLWSHVAVPGSDAERVVRVGCVVLATSYVVRMLGDAIAGPGHHDERWAQQVRLLVSHSGELAGWMAVATGLAAAYVGLRRSGRASS